MKKFKHVVITRFNYPDDKKDLFNERMKLFNKFTLLNMKNQTCMDFTWVFFSDKDLNIDFDNKKFVNLTSYNKFKKELELEYDYIIETRLDNDDIFSKNMIEVVQDVFKSNIKERDTLLIESKGFRYDMRNDTFYEDIFYSKTRSSPFISLCSKLGSDNYVFDYVHGQMCLMFDTFFIDNKLWVQMIHNSNKLMNKDSELIISNRGIKCEEPNWFTVLR